MLHDHRDHLRVQFTQDCCALRAAPFIDLALALPQLEQQFDLPARPPQHQRFAHVQLLLRHIRHKQCPLGQCQLARIRRPSASFGLRRDPPSPLISHLLRHPRRQQSALQSCARSQADWQIYRGCLLRGQETWQIQALPLLVEHRRRHLRACQPVTKRLANRTQHVQVEKAQVGDAQCSGRNGFILERDGFIGGQAVIGVRSQ